MTKRRQDKHAIRAIAAVAWLLALVGPGMVGAGQEEQFTPEFREPRTTRDPKHTPLIAAPDSVKRGQWFDVTVSVGVESMHPSLSEHFVRYIALYKDRAEIARVYLHPVFSAPKVTFTIALDEGGMLRAVAEPTHSAAWEASRKIAVVP
jgi:superoxide reductase